MGIVFSNSDAPIEEKSADHCAKAYSIHRRRFCRREMLRSAKESLLDSLYLNQKAFRMKLDGRERGENVLRNVNKYTKRFNEPIFK